RHGVHGARVRSCSHRPRRRARLRDRRAREGGQLMAKVRQRSWTVPGQRTKRKAWGFVTIETGKHRATCAEPTCGGCQQVRQFRAEWTKEQAEGALSKYRLKIEPPKPPANGLTLAQACERYLNPKARNR